jgi:hypothetical protein
MRDEHSGHLELIRGQRRLTSALFSLSSYVFFCGGVTDGEAFVAGEGDALGSFIAEGSSTGVPP